MKQFPQKGAVVADFYHEAHDAGTQVQVQLIYTKKKIWESFANSRICREYNLFL